jgi:pilus assembly protein Flp/PilA
MRFLNDERGASALENGLLVGGLAVMLMVGASAIGTSLNDTFEEIDGALGSGQVHPEEVRKATDWSNAPAALLEQHGQGKKL